METDSRRPWTLGTGDAESVLAEARRALFVMVGFLAILWIIQLINFADGYGLVAEFGIRPRDVSTLPNILTAPFVHVSWTHIESNSGPLFIFGFLAAYRGVVRFFGLTVLVIVTSGLVDWIGGTANTVGVGASGVVFGYLGYILVRGLFDRHVIDIVIAAVMALCFAYQFTVLLPHNGIGWQDHIGGLVGGVLGGWIFRERAHTRSATRTRIAGKRVSTAADGDSGSGAGGDSSGANVAKGSAANGDSEPRQGAGDADQDPDADLKRELDDLGL